MLFHPMGVHTIVDGQFGSTGKGALAAFLADQAWKQKALAPFTMAISSSGPNSGHTSYRGELKIVSHYLPTFAIHAYLLGMTVPVYLSAGSIITPHVLFDEARQFSDIPIVVNPQAAIVRPEDLLVEKTNRNFEKISSTQQGTGSAFARKIMRDPGAVVKNALEFKKDRRPENITIDEVDLEPWKHAYFMEISQGFSLGIHSEFYPFVTSRECTVMQGLADARIPPGYCAKTYLCIRTFPIRVGSLPDSSSGGHYADQDEIKWQEIGQEPELTTVTKRERRIFTFSNTQFFKAMRANDPTHVAVNFLNYIASGKERDAFMHRLKVLNDLTRMGSVEFIEGWGPRVKDWRMYEDDSSRDTGGNANLSEGHSGLPASDDSQAPQEHAQGAVGESGRPQSDGTPA